jgi:lipopolysaccharide export system protein LptA
MILNSEHPNRETLLDGKRPIPFRDRWPARPVPDSGDGIMTDQPAGLRPYLIGPLLGLLLIMAAPCAWPLAGDRQQAIHIESDRLEIDERRRQSLYRGHVEMRQGSLRIRADQIRFLFDADNNLLRLEIEGQPASFEQTTDQGQTLRGSARRILYHSPGAILELSGKARLENGGDVVESERIRYNIESNALEAGKPDRAGDSGNPDGEDHRVRMVIQPRAEPDPPPQPAPTRP